MSPFHLFRVTGRFHSGAKLSRLLFQPADLRWICFARAPTTPTGLRRRTAKPALPSQAFHHAGRPRPAACHEEDWDDSPNPCAPVRPKESSGAHAAAETPFSAQTKVAEFLVPGKRKCSELLFLLTTVDGSREDDIDVGRSGVRPQKRQRHGCFRSLFEAESCPAPFVYGSRFYCFRSPGTEAMARGGLNSRREVGAQRNKAEEALASPRAASLCSRRAGTEASHREGDGEGEQKLAVAYERLRHELPNFFRKNHDYTMYSSDIEFINGLLNTKTRGRAAYQLTLSLWRLVCLVYFADAQLEVLKLTKHVEDGSIKARWRLRGLPFLTLMLRFYRKDKSPLYRCYDAFSTFYVGHDGLIHCHKVEKVMPAQPPALPGVTSLLAGALVALGVQENRPALNLLPLLLSSPRQGRE
ncbi:uncharacterized protein C6orf136 homolog [Hippocampus zosterae]|uniref:uncharacterized protein C6orf136 homolog n=1 Tax=Hippocampus zosterae TaxID=109293 RepID=UPI00223E7FF0|nr:uncharacterized protein C6orf136 homolog [Hippocampus zosterae]